MIILNSENGVTVVPEMPIGTRFKIKDWLLETDYPEGTMPNIEFEVMEAFPDETGDVPCHCDAHQCAFDCICGASIECPCSAHERKDGKNVRYIEYCDGREYHW